MKFMDEEIYNVVDENDKVIGSAPREEIHRLGLKHRAVHILVFNSKGEVFLQKRSMKKDRCPGLWDSSASGHVDREETYDDTAKRELHEELGILCKDSPTRLFKLPASEETDNEHVYVYCARHEGPFNLNKDEIETGLWVSPDSLNEWIKKSPQDFSRSFLIIWEKISGHIQTLCHLSC
jgi:isopentenyl-diphosphate delta-isomerase type 1